MTVVTVTQILFVGIEFASVKHGRLGILRKALTEVEPEFGGDNEKNRRGYSCFNFRWTGRLGGQIIGADIAEGKVFRGSCLSRRI
jgi:hypothetical protein